MGLLAPGVGLLVGVLSGFLFFLGMSGAGWVLGRLRSVVVMLREFQGATTDDERGRCLRRAGVQLLLVSLSCVVFFMIMGSLGMAGPILLAGSGWDSSSYWAVVLIASMAMYFACRRVVTMRSGGKPL